MKSSPASEIDELTAFRKDHLAWPLITENLGRVSEDEARAYLMRRKQRILQAEADPLKHGYIPPIWRVLYEQIAQLRAKFPQGVTKLIVWGGNRAGKSAMAARLIMDRCVSHPGSLAWCCDSTEAMARANLMRLLHNYMPQEWKNLERNAITDLRYTIADGFPKNHIVFPNKSEISFKFYSMDISNLPGPEIDIIHCDELIPLIWVNTLVYRLVNRNGLLLITFTPELGWNETYQHFYEGAQIIEETEAELLPKYGENGEQIGYRRVPRVMQCADPSARIVFFHTADNPFGNYPALKQELDGKGEEEILIRAYGVCTKAHTLRFPMFNPRVHTITQAQFAAVIKDNPKTMRFHLVDPCDGRNWFMVWAACPYPDKWIIYREWPSFGHPKAYIEGVGMPGPWAVSGAAADGVKGPAQKPFGFGLATYRDEILRVEEGEQIDARYIDSRYATSPRTGAEHVTSLIEQIAEVGMDFVPMVPGKGKIVSLDKNDGSLDMINSALFYDVETDIGEYSPKLSRLNEPQLLILDTCPNTIYSLAHFTGDDGQRGACKDPIDCVRGMFLSSVNYFGDDMYKFVGGGVV